MLGAGVVGLCCAVSLQKDGHSVTLVDRMDPEHISNGDSSKRERNLATLSGRVLTSPYRVLELISRVISVRDSGR